VSREDVGLCGPAQQLPPELSGDLRKKALELPRTHVEAPDQFKETDMVTHACLAISRNLFMEIGMEHPNLISGTDPDLRNRVRERGLKVGIVPGTRVFHPPIQTWDELLRANFSGGRRSRAVKREYPDYHLKADPNITSEEEARHEGLPSKIFRHGKHLRQKLTNGNFWSLSAQIAYVIGYCYEWIVPKKWVEPIPYPENPHPASPGWEALLDHLKRQGEVKWLHGPLTESVNDSL